VKTAEARIRWDDSESCQENGMDVVSEIVFAEVQHQRWLTVLNSNFGKILHKIVNVAILKEKIFDNIIILKEIIF